MTLQQSALSVLTKFKSVNVKYLALYLYGSDDFYDVQATHVIISRLRKKGHKISRGPNYRLIERADKQ